MDLIVIAALIFSIALLIKSYARLTSGVCQSKRSLRGKTVIVTGANSGIGLETARELARRDARVILACRNLERGLTAAKDIKMSTNNNDVEVKLLDLSSLSSVRKFADEIKSTEHRLDVLIHNAGMVTSPGKRFTEDNLEILFATNHFGPFLLTNLLLDLLKKSAPSRIVIVSSVTHFIGQLNLENLNGEKYKRNSFWNYCSSKLANVLFTRELSDRLIGSGVTVNALHPGGVRTKITKNEKWFAKYLIVPLFYPFLKSAESGAQTSVYLSVSEEVEGVSGQYFVDCRPSWTSPSAKNKELAKNCGRYQRL